MENVIEDKVLQDCKKLLTLILNNYPNHQNIEVEVACLPDANKRMSGNVYRKTTIYLYSYPETISKLHAEGVIEKLPNGIIQDQNIAEIFYEAITSGKELLQNGIYYNRNLVGYYKLRINRNASESWLNNNGYYVIEPNQYFGFYDTNFFLKLVDGGNAVINFYSKRNEPSDTFYFFQALVSVLKRDYKIKDKFITTTATVTSIIKELNKSGFKKDVTSMWLKSTRGNLIKKIPREYEHLINIGNFDRKSNSYSFKLMLPL